MKINIKATQIKMTPDVASYLDKKLESVKRVVSGSDSAVCGVEIGKTTRHHKTGDIFKGEINLRMDGKSFYAIVESDDLYRAIDGVKDEIVKEIKSYKEKKKSLAKKGGSEVKKIMRGLKGN